MHIPDGYISPSTSAVAFAAVTPFWIIAAKRAQTTLQSAAAPRLGLFAAFSFLVMMINIPLPYGTSGHAVGGALMALVLGPWQAVLGVSAALTIQALFFGDGGLMALGANCLILGVLLPFTAYGSYHTLRRGRLSESWAAGLSGWIGLMAAALAVAVVLGLQPHLFQAADGTPLYNPYGLGIAVPVMLISHALVAAPAEGLVTSLVWNYLRRAMPGIVEGRAGTEGKYRLGPAWAAVLILALLSPLGLLAANPAWGEWGLEEIQQKVGYVPAGMEKFQTPPPTVWWPDYTVSGLSEPAAYVLSAFLGIALCVGIFVLFSRVTPARRRAAAPGVNAPSDDKNL